MVEDDFFFRTVEGRRLEALRHNPASCVAVSHSTNDGGWQSVVFWGDAEVVEDAPVEAAVIAALLRKYDSEAAFAFSTAEIIPRQRSVVRIRPVRLSGRSSGEGLTTRIRPGRL